MSIITKESIADTIEGLELLVNRGIQSVHIDMAIAGMRRLLASLEAEPVAYMWDSDRKDVDAPGYYRPEHKIFAESSVKRYGGKVVALYAAQPAQASLEAEESGRNPVLAYADSYRDMAKQGVESIPVWSVITDLERNIAPLFAAPSC